jgi:hypothetical protein
MTLQGPACGCCGARPNSAHAGGAPPAISSAATEPDASNRRSLLRLTARRASAPLIRHPFYATPRYTIRLERLVARYNLFFCGRVFVFLRACVCFFAGVCLLYFGYVTKRVVTGRKFLVVQPEICWRKVVMRKPWSVAARVAERPLSDIGRAAVGENRPYPNPRRVGLDLHHGAAQEDGFGIDNQCRRLQ